MIWQYDYIIYPKKWSKAYHRYTFYSNYVLFSTWLTKKVILLLTKPKPFIRKLWGFIFLMSYFASSSYT